MSTAAIMVNSLHYIKVNVVCNTELLLTINTKCSNILEAIHLSYTLSDDPNIKSENSFSIRDGENNSELELDCPEKDNDGVLDSDSEPDTPSAATLENAVATTVEVPTAHAFLSTPNRTISTTHAEKKHPNLDMPPKDRFTDINRALF